MGNVDVSILMLIFESVEFYILSGKVFSNVIEASTFYSLNIRVCDEENYS
jgi:hypothetical protein